MDVIYEDLDSSFDTRNADRRVMRPGTIVHGRTNTGFAPATRVSYPAASVMYGQPPATSMTYPPTYAQAPYWGPLGILGGLNLANLISAGGKLWAAFKAQPAAPVPTGDVGTDIANSILHESAQWAERKSEQRIVAVSSAIAELLGAR
jgi:hypothetical protein